MNRSVISTSSGHLFLSSFQVLRHNWVFPVGRSLYDTQKEIDKNRYENLSDINIAVESLYDVMTDPELKQVVFVTNDSDFAPAMKKIQALGKVTVGLVIPTTFSARRPNQDLAKHANWVRDCIQDYELAASQLPRLIPGEHKPAVKPISWYGQPEILEQITQTLMPVCEQKLAKCWRWLEHPVPLIEGLSPLVGLPINHLNTEQEALLVLKYAEKFAEMMANAQTSGRFT
jgi:hypothetical protein